MAKVTPCQAGYACPYCRQLDTSHTVSLLPHCPIVWIGENDVYDTLTGERMPFVQRPQSKQHEDDYPLFPNGQVPRYERRHGNVVQMEQKNRL